MIAQLRGIVAARFGNSVILDVQGVGYELLCTAELLAGLEEGSERSVIVFTEVREDAIKLFGFVDRLEREVFVLLQKVRGIGAKSALDLLSGMTVRELLRAIGNGDVIKLQSIKGVGRKTAERVVLELKEKVAEYVLTLLPDEPAPATRSARGAVGDRWVEDGVDALVALGFGRKEAQQAVDQARARGAFTNEGDTSELVRQALQFV